MPDLGGSGYFQGQSGVPGAHLTHIAIAIILNICHSQNPSHRQKQRQNGAVYRYRCGGRLFLPASLFIQSQDYQRCALSAKYWRGRFTERSTVADNEDPLADFPFDKLPTELLIKIFHHTRPNSVLEDYNASYPYPVALSHVCRHWRKVALGAPTLWTDIRIVQYETEEIREATRVYLERSKTCPIFLTWFPDRDQPYTNARGVIDDLIIPRVERWQRITLVAEICTATDALLTAMEFLDFPILQDLEIPCMLKRPSSNTTFCRNAPLLRRYRVHECWDTPPLPPLPSNLVVLDFTFSAAGSMDLDLDPLLEFLPHVAHSLEHLRLGLHPLSEIRVTPRTSKIPLEHLKSLLIKGSHVITDHISTPNLTYLTVSCPHGVVDAVKMFKGFSAPVLRSIQFFDTLLRPILDAHHFPSTFPQLESATLSGCTDELSFVLLLEPPESKKSRSSQKAPEHGEVQNPFPNLKELTISDMTIWTSLQAAIEKRLKNGDKTLRKIRLPKGEATEAIMPHLRRWLPARGIELVLYEPGELSTSTPEFQDDFCDEEARLFLDMMELTGWEQYSEEDDDIDDYWDGFYDGYDEDEDDDDDDDLYDYDNDHYG